MTTDTNQPYSVAGKRVWIAGHRGLVGSALVRRLQQEDCEIVTATRSELDLTRQSDVRDWLADTRPQAVILAAARVGGILANDRHPVDFLRDNLAMEVNTISASHEVGVEKFLFLGSSCIYPKHADQPISEDALLTGALEPTNQWYAIAKIAGLKLCEAYRRQYGADFISAMPTNLYGPGDSFDPVNSHVIPALIQRFDAAERENSELVTIWGSGKPRREFLYVDDCADALVAVLAGYSDFPPINVGSGEDLTIAQLAANIADVVGFTGRIAYDTSKPDGTPRKLLDVRRLQALGWRPHTSLADGLRATYEWYCEHQQS